MGSILKQSKLLHDIWLASLGMIGHNYELQVHSYGGGGHISKTKKGNPNPALKKRNDEDSQRKSVNASWVMPSFVSQRASVNASWVKPSFVTQRASVNASSVMPSLITHRQKSIYRDVFNAPVYGLEASGSVNSRINATKSNLRRIELEHDENYQSSEKFSDNVGEKTLHHNRTSVQDSAENSTLSVSFSMFARKKEEGVKEKRQGEEGGNFAQTSADDNFPSKAEEDEKEGGDVVDANADDKSLSSVEC